MQFLYLIDADVSSLFYQVIIKQIQKNWQKLLKLKK